MDRLREFGVREMNDTRSDLLNSLGTKSGVMNRLGRRSEVVNNNLKGLMLHEVKCRKSWVNKATLCIISDLDHGYQPGVNSSIKFVLDNGCKPGVNKVTFGAQEVEAFGAQEEENGQIPERSTYCRNAHAHSNIVLNDKKAARSNTVVLEERKLDINILLSAKGCRRDANRIRLDAIQTNISAPTIEHVGVNMAILRKLIEEVAFKDQPFEKKSISSIQQGDGYDKHSNEIIPFSSVNSEKAAFNLKSGMVNCSSQFISSSVQDEADEWSQPLRPPVSTGGTPCLNRCDPLSQPVRPTVSTSATPSFRASAQRDGVNSRS